MKKLSLQWRLTIITTLFIALICGCLTMFVYSNGVYYINSLQDAVTLQDENEIYIGIPDGAWDGFVEDFYLRLVVMFL